ncbi:hypothetical protein [Robertmurraya kyonggiensis]|uniref:hypothetical protein n=1 Tax=Robertmurraya kyonggiensis TaxID=1037680 RepID=UPI00130DAD70|nr:hypothetical protein [Robertmurraya kyonggiensis]
MSTSYKSKYDYPRVSGEFKCTGCKRTNSLPANYCGDCGKELEEAQKKGLKKYE